jgi:FAD/FMN-containing dehydrogenase
MRITSLPRSPMAAHAPSLAFVDFPVAFKGPNFRPGDDGYPDAKRLWNARHEDDQPALIVQPIDTDDVVLAVQYAIHEDISIAVRSGGHGIDCFAMPHDAFVIDTSRLKRISVDPATGRIEVEAGVLLGEMDAATQAHGYVIPAGTVTETGVAGLTLGGGIGHLTRRFGATVDSLVSVDVVTMDGRVITASADQNAELFWGMRGAGHNLAIATKFTYQGHKVGPQVMSGPLFYAGDEAVALLAGLDEAMSRAPRELAMTPVVMPAPPLPGMPEQMIGSPVVMPLVVYTGPLEGYEAAMSGVRALATPVADLVGPSTWLEANALVDPQSPSGRRQHSGGGYLPAMTEEVARIVLERVGASPVPTSPAPSCLITLPMLGGALHDFDEDSAAFSRSGAAYLYEVVGQWDLASSDDEFVGWVHETMTALAPHVLTNGYVNLTVDRGSDWLQSVYGSAEKWERIVALKRAWDPENRLSHNKNVLRALAGSPA